MLVAPGNAGTHAESNMRNVLVSVEDFDGLVALAKSESVIFTMVGPEVPLVQGVVDRFQFYCCPNTFSAENAEYR